MNNDSQAAIEAEYIARFGQLPDENDSQEDLEETLQEAREALEELRGAWSDFQAMQARIEAYSGDQPPAADVKPVSFLELQETWYSYLVAFRRAGELGLLERVQ